MPLSEHEQRLLDQIERQLYAEDPKFAAAVRSHDLKTHVTRRVTRFAVLLVLGLAVLVTGVILRNVIVGVAGFLLMLGGAFLVVRSVQRLRVRDTAANVTRLDRRRRFRRSRRGGDGGSIRERAEERFRRRFEDRDR